MEGLLKSFYTVWRSEAISHLQSLTKTRSFGYRLRMTLRHPRIAGEDEGGGHALRAFVMNDLVLVQPFELLQTTQLPRRLQALAHDRP
jgi:hypothetical protein